MCCKVLHIAELAKPANRWCEHIAPGGGCAIYDTRFHICRAYRCLWLTDEGFGPEWQPNRSKFIMHQVDGKAGLWVNVDKGYPLAWKQQPFYGQLKRMSEMARDGSGYVAVCVGSKMFVVFPEEDLEVPDCPPDADLKVGYRHRAGMRMPLVQVREPDGKIREHLGSAMAA